MVQARDASACPPDYPYQLVVSDTAARGRTWSCFAEPSASKGADPAASCNYEGRAPAAPAGASATDAWARAPGAPACGAARNPCPPDFPYKLPHMAMGGKLHCFA